MKRVASLRHQIVLIVLLCWLTPVLLLLIMMGWYTVSTVGSRAERELNSQLGYQLQMYADRLDTAVYASRLASYDTTIREAWEDYAKDGSWAELYRRTRRFVVRQYGSDRRFDFAVFWFTLAPDEMEMLVVNETLGGIHKERSESWRQDCEKAREIASTLDTSLGFLECEGRLYLLRNIVGADFAPIGTLALELNSPYYFEELSSFVSAEKVRLELGENAELALRGGEITGTERRILRASAESADFELKALAVPDYDVLLSQLRIYYILLAVMLLLLLPLILGTAVFFRRRVSRPIEELLRGADAIEQGDLGYQVGYSADTREFCYLIDSFNHMSGELKQQFERQYREELTLRDAQIKALQAHINPHFLNNTLEIINWEARINGDETVSSMIEALSTVMDAALDRRKSPEIPLGEELHYVSAYLHIIKERFGSRIRIIQDIPDSLLGCLVPRLILQPVIENAVEHGMRPDGQGLVRLGARTEGEYLILEVANNGEFTEGDRTRIARLLSKGYDPSGESSGNIGIANVNLRLRILYGDACGLNIDRRENGEVVARLTILRHEQGAANSGKQGDNEVQQIASTAIRGEGEK